MEARARAISTRRKVRPQIPFWKTSLIDTIVDDRFVIKEMMNAWNVAEKDAFLKFAPKYFDHVKKSANVSMNKARCLYEIS